ncbi:MAG: DUF3048 domain-containing protein [Actinomycetota bacterium]|nr:DUF3048 domain-containing protein [Actinomycetota bacterium]
MAGTVGLLLVVPLSGCQSGSAAPEGVGREGGLPPVTSAPAPTEETPLAPTPALQPATAPLTGVPVDAADGVTGVRPAVAVAISVRRAAPPAEGLDAADVIYEEIGRRGPTRLLALFHSMDTGRVGPVTTTRPLDPKLLSVAAPLYAHKGGSTGFLQQVANSDLVDVSYAEHPRAYDGDGAPGTTPDALFTSTRKLRRAGASDLAPPPALFVHASAGQQLAGEGLTAAATLRVPLPGPDAVWRLDTESGQWRRDDGSGVTAAADNVIVQQVQYRTIRVRYPDGRTVRTALPQGAGRIHVVSGDQSATGTWYKPFGRTVTNYADTAGAPMKLAPGRTWVMLAPRGTRTTVRSGS